MPSPIEAVVFSFEGLLPELDSLPIAARRALDHAGIRLSQEGWRSLKVEDREALAIAGGAEVIDVDHVHGVAKRSQPHPQRVAAVGDPDAAIPPDALVKALEPNRTIDARRWGMLRSLDRYALTHTYRRAVARSAFSLLGEAFDAILSARPMSPVPPRLLPAGSPPPGSQRPAAPPWPLPGYYSQAPSDARAITVANISSHLNAEGEARMVDVGAKPATHRRAVASGCVQMKSETAKRLAEGDTPKGDVLAAARIAAIMATKRTPDLIPLCHVVALTKVDVEIDIDIPRARVTIVAVVEADDKTGVEMEAMVAVSVGCLTIYDMLKGLDRAMTIADVRLLEKTGGKTGPFRRPPSDRP